MRGINRQDIFYDQGDYQRFLGTLGRVRTDKFEVYGYCLMSNHVHLLIREKSEEIPQIMKRIGTSYVWWYNRKYQRTGHVFQGRYGSECVEDDEYLLTVIRYIHQNPVKAGMISEPEDYRWSSIQAYYSEHEDPTGLTDTSFMKYSGGAGLLKGRHGDRLPGCVDYQNIVFNPTSHILRVI